MAPPLRPLRHPVPQPHPTHPPAPTFRSLRQKFFGHTALVLLVLQTCYTTVFVAAFSSVLATDDCGYPWRVLAVLEFFQASGWLVSWAMVAWGSELGRVVVAGGSYGLPILCFRIA